MFHRSLRHLELALGFCALGALACSDAAPPPEAPPPVAQAPAAPVKKQAPAVADPPPEAKAEDKPVGKVAEVTGEVRRKALDAGQWVTVHTGAPLSNGDEVHAIGDGSGAQLELKDGSQLKLSAGTRVAIDVNPLTRRHTTLTLMLGRLWLNVPKLFGKQRFEVQTATAVAGIRGTIFRIAVGRDAATLVTVEEGAVAVKPAAALEAEPQAGQGEDAPPEVLVKAEQKSEVAPGGQAAAPEAYASNDIDGIRSWLEARVEAAELRMDTLAGGWADGVTSSSESVASMLQQIDTLRGRVAEVAEQVDQAESEGDAMKAANLRGELSQLSERFFALGAKARDQKRLVDARVALLDDAQSRAQKGGGKISPKLAAAVQRAHTRQDKLSQSSGSRIAKLNVRSQAVLGALKKRAPNAVVELDPGYRAPVMAPDGKTNKPAALPGNIAIPAVPKLAQAPKLPKGMTTKDRRVNPVLPKAVAKKLAAKPVPGSAVARALQKPTQAVQKAVAGAAKQAPKKPVAGLQKAPAPKAQKAEKPAEAADDPTTGEFGIKPKPNAKMQEKLAKAIVGKSKPAKTGWKDSAALRKDADRLLKAMQRVVRQSPFVMSRDKKAEVLEKNSGDLKRMSKALGKLITADEAALKGKLEASESAKVLARVNADKLYLRKLKGEISRFREQIAAYREP